MKKNMLYSVLNRQLGRKLREYRYKQRKSSQQMAETFGISSALLYKLETGRLSLAPHPKLLGLLDLSGIYIPEEWKKN